jgi:hypothetical protein
MQTLKLSFTAFAFFATSLAGAQSAPALPDWLVHPRTETIANFYGTYTESGVLTTRKTPSSTQFEEIEAKVWYDKPMQYVVQYVAPDRFKGSFSTFDGDQLTIFFAKLNFSVVYRHMPPLKDNSKYYYTFDPQRYTYALSEKASVAGNRTVAVKFTPIATAPGRFEGEWKFVEAFSFPAAYTVNIGNTKFQRVYSRLVINEDPVKHKKMGSPGKHPSLAVPSGANKMDWDLSAAGVSEQDARAAYADFRLPTTLPQGLKLLKISRQTGLVPAFSATYTNPENAVMIVMLVKDFHIPPPKPQQWGIPVEALHATKGEFTPGLVLNSYDFIDGGTRYLIMSTLSLEDMLVAANAIPAPAPAPTPAGK